MKRRAVLLRQQSLLRSRFQLQVVQLALSGQCCWLLPTPMIVVGVGFSAAFVRLSVCLSVCFPHDIPKTATARITKLDIEMFHRESLKLVYLEI